jgi:adenine-specific DNA-methyltransferase
MPFLDWVNKAQAVQAAGQVPYHLLNFESQHGDPAADNLLIQGDNLLALKALLPFYRGRVKCVFIDPPYNTQSAFEHYDDKLEHSQWLSMMHPRLVLLRELLAEDGSIWVTLDEAEAHYFKVLADEVFGRECFIADVAWKRRDGAPNDRKIGPIHDHLFVFARRIGLGAKTRAEEVFGLMERTEKADAEYREFEEPFGVDPRGAFRKVDSTANAKGGRFVESLVYPVINPFTGEAVFPRKGRCWVYHRDVMEEMVRDRRYFWGKDGKAGTPMRKLFRSEAKAGMTAPSIWDDAGLNQHGARELELLFGEKASFDTPKPEKLLQRVLTIATKPGEIVLDSFLGSGTTAAVAQKMGRRYIGIEMGAHARTHCLPRLERVIAGEQGGISKAVNWQGGGGFRFYTLGEPVFDAHGSINPAVRFAALAAYLWHFETGQPATQALAATSPLLGVHEGTAYFLLYNGVLGDRRPAGGNVLTGPVLAHLEDVMAQAGHAGTVHQRVVYGETTRLSEQRLQEAGVRFRQIPYDIQAR